MTDGTPGDDDSPFVPMTVDVEALKEQAYEDGYRDGMEEARSIGYKDGYRERTSDIIERLRIMLESGMDLGSCIAELEQEIMTPRGGEI